MAATALAASILLVASGGLTASGATSAIKPIVDYPSWEEVEAARNDQAVTEQLVAELGASLNAAQEQSVVLSDAALQAVATAASAQSRADAATVVANTLRQQSAVAAELSATSQADMELLASGLVRAQSGGPVWARVLTEDDPDRLLFRLGALEKLASVSRDIASVAERDKQVALSLQRAAEDAEVARSELAAKALADADAASAAADAEIVRVASLQADVDTMYAQLAALRGTTAEAERLYRLGQEVAAQEAIRAANEASNAPPPSAPAPTVDPPSAPNPPAPPTYGVVVSPADAQAYARTAAGNYGWGEDQFTCLVSLWNRESGWRADALNPSSGAYGIPQSLPGNKMAAAGADWRTNAATQINWGLSYISDRYGAPCGAWAHSERTGWY